MYYFLRFNSKIEKLKNCHKYLKLNDLNAYKISFKLSNFVWKIIINWENLAKYSLGKQYINSIDSISANIAEGFGRYNKKDKIRFYHYSLGSVYESLDWNEKSFKRKLINIGEYQKIFSTLNILPTEIRSLIKFTQNKLIR